ncbi:MAG: response regulator [Desulfobacteraceae bacterium]|nr:response regulator [Desulfobacteraceae bacterium]
MHKDISITKTFLVFIIATALLLSILTAAISVFFQYNSLRQVTENEYADNLRENKVSTHNELKKNIIRQICLSLILFLILFTAVLIAGILSVLIFSDTLQREFNIFISFFNNAVSKNRRIDPNTLSIKELKLLAGHANRMCDEIDQSGQALRNLNEELEYKASQRTAQLKIVNAELEEAIENTIQMAIRAEEASKAKSTFLANMSHEIRTPMNAIIGFARLALKSGIKGEHRDYLDKIMNASNSLLKIINDVLDFSKIEAGKIDIEPVNFLLQDILDDLADLFAIPVSEKNVEMNIYADQNVPDALVGDPLRIKQILRNLASNAVKFTDTGEIIISVACTEETRDSATLNFIVKDTGIGISEENIIKIFSAFAQADGTITRKYGGTGLGLDICSRLAKMMGGEIRVESEPGKGSIFSFSLLLEKQAGQTDISYDISNTRKLKALVANENPNTRTALSGMLQSLGCETVISSSGFEALKKLKQEAKGDSPFRLLLASRKMPDTNGIRRLAWEIRQNPEIADIAIIVLSGSVRVQRLKQETNTGINGVLIKPVKLSALYDTLLEVVGKKPKDSLSDEYDTEKQSGGPLEGARVLLAEDNAINQEVALKLLKEHGITADTAVNGEEAVEAVEKKEYDAVLMDIQMPKINGYEAAKMIRQKSKDIPIIAMTAYVMKSAREECLDAGMNDYISKPVDPDQLFAVLMKWVLPGEQKTSASQAPEYGVSENDSAWSFPAIPGVDAESALKRLKGDAKLFRKLLKNFEKKYAGFPQTLEDAFSAGAYDQACSLVHALKGVAGNLSAVSLEKAAADLETALNQRSADDSKDSSEIRSKVKPVEQALAQVLESVRMIEKQSESTPEVISDEKSKPLNISEIRPTLIRLSEALEACRTESEVFVESLKNQLHLSDTDEKIHQLEDQIRVFDFDGAQKTLVEIADIIGVSL